MRNVRRRSLEGGTEAMIAQEQLGADADDGRVREQLVAELGMFGEHSAGLGKGTFSTTDGKPLISPELYLVLSGHATFTIGGTEVEAPAGMLVFVSDPAVERLAVANETNTVVLSIGAAAEGQAFEAVGWDTSYLEG